MQTFLPYADFKRSAQCLDNKRLGKQRVETLQILHALFGMSKGWTNHPATKMWRGYEFALCVYGVAICGEWRCRGFKDTCMEKIAELTTLGSASGDFPPWFGDEQFHLSHQSNLLRKDAAWYSQWGWSVRNDLEYVWPV